MSNLSELLPAGAGAKSADFVASGTLGSGVTVALKADGTVEAVTATTLSAVDNAGTPSTFVATDSVFYISSTYDAASQKIVVVFQDRTTPSYGTAAVGTVSGTSISFGTPVVFESATTRETACAYDAANEKIVIAYRDDGNSGYGTSVVGTVSGTSISFGTAVVFESAASEAISISYDETEEKSLLAFRGSSNLGWVIVGTISGTSISFGSKVSLNGAITTYISSAYDPVSQQHIIAYRNVGSSSRGTVRVGAVSGTSVSFGPATEFNTVSTQWTQTVYDTNAQKVVIAYSDVANSEYGTAIVGTVTGTGVVFGSPVVFRSARSVYISATYDANAQKIVIAYRDLGNSSYGTINVGTVSGTSISFGSDVIFESATSLYIASTYDSNAQKVVVSYTDGGNSNYGTSAVWTTGFSRTETNSADFIGITDQAIADTATGAVIVQGGVSDKVSSLTTGSDYYVQADGSLSTTVSSVPAGRSLSSTSILLEG